MAATSTKAAKADKDDDEDRDDRSPGAAAAEANDPPEGPIASPVLTPPTAEAVKAATSRNAQLYEVTLAHSVARHRETGRIVSLPEAVDPVSGLPLEDYEVLQPEDTVQVTYDIGHSLLSGGYLTLNPYDNVAVDVAFSTPVKQK